nr:alpha-amylase [Eubacterium sp.]
MTNKTLMQYFEWYLPDNGLLWKRCQAQAKALKEAGIDMIWLPPAYKGAAGQSSVGYDVYDTYDLGEFDQKGSVRTKYGTRDEYLTAVKALQEQGIQVLSDVVLNHMMGADGTETVMVEETAGHDREQEISGKHPITAWTRFDFPGRQGKYSDFHWNASHFSGTDWDQGAQRNGIFRFEGKEWNRETDAENGNYDYLMGADLDTANPETVKAVTEWGKWYLDTVHMDGFRLDAVKHISFDFYREWLKNVRAHAGRDLFVVGEYWSKEIEKMLHYLDVTENSLSLFDVTLHFSFLHAATSNGNFDMRTLFDTSVVKARPQNAVTFVDNHDTQPGQALQSFIPAWFKPIAYALILLRKDGIPCVFYGDYYGIPHDKIPAVSELKRLLYLRRNYAYGEQTDYFDDASVVGFTRSGDAEHPDSGMAVLITDSVAGRKRMHVGQHFAGVDFFDAMGHFSEPVRIGEDGWGEFMVDGGSVAVWVPRTAYESVCTEVE